MPALFAGGVPDEMLLLARVLGEAAAELRRVQVRAEWGAGATGRPAEAATLAAKVRVWADTSSEEVRRRARQLADKPRLNFEEPQFLPLAGAAHGARQIKLTHAEAQLEAARAVTADPNASAAAKKAAKRVLNTYRKETGGTPSRPRKDAKPPPKSKTSKGEEAAQLAAKRAAKQAARVEAEKAAEARRAAEVAQARDILENDGGILGDGEAAKATVAGLAVGVWWAGKLLSPACGPAVVVCAAVL
ncbi:MAG: hypothetical protein ACR2MO_07355 [Acidimicrobiales bacterium]